MIDASGTVHRGRADHGQVYLDRSTTLNGSGTIWIDGLAVSEQPCGHTERTRVATLEDPTVTSSGES